jgi:biopolymer transport protein TolR
MNSPASSSAACAAEDTEVTAHLPPPPRRRKLAHEINVVPYIDVMLVLLIIFMVTAPLLTPGIDVDLPKVDADSLGVQDEPVTLYVDAQGRYFLDVGEKQDAPLSDDEVVRLVGAVLRSKPQTTIIVKGDARVPYERVAMGMGLLREAGAARIGFATEPSGGRRRGE